jgi:hypothetical protein
VGSAADGAVVRSNRWLDKEADMKALARIRQPGRAIALGLAVAAVLAGAGQAVTQGDAVRALQVRGEGLNVAYGLGGSTQSGDAISALATRSEAMNERYVQVGGSGAEVVGALAIRSQAMNEQYGPGSTTGNRAGFDWADAGVGITVALGAALLAAAGALILRRQRRPAPTRLS